MAYSYKTAISFGMIYIPVTLHAAIKNNDIGFNMLDKKTLSRIKYQKTCVDCDGRLVEQKEIVKGYEYEKGKYVVLSDEDFEKLKTAKDKSITIEKFADIEQIDPIYYDRSYYVLPQGADKAFSLLVSAMEQTKKTAFARTILGTKETLVALRVKEGGLILNTLFFHEELSQSPAKDAKHKAEGKELDMAKMIIENMSDKINMEDYTDEYRQRVMNAIQAKISGKEPSVKKEAKSAKIIDLMQALEMSLKQSKKPAEKNKKTKTNTK